MPPALNWNVLRRLLAYARPHRGILARAFACMVFLGLTTGAYAWLMGPALRFLLSGGVEGLSWAQRLVPGLARERALWALPVAIVVIGAVKGLAYLGQFYWSGLFGQRVVLDLRRDLFARLVTLSPVQLSQRLSGDLLARFSADVGAVETAATYAVASYVRDGLQIVILVVVALAVNWKLAIALLGVVPLAAIPASRLTRSVLRRTREAQARLGDLAGQVQEGISGVRSIQAFNAQAAELARFDGFVAAQQRAMTRAAWARAGVPGIMEVLAAAALGGTLAFAATTHAIPPDELVSVLAAVILVYQPAKDLGRVSQFVVSAVAAGGRLFELLALPRAVEDEPSARPLGTMQTSLRVEELSFSYGPDRPALDRLTLEVPSGQVTALVGPSGGGKSTLASLLLRFEKPSAGRILIDGQDVALATQSSVRAQFALVTQEPLLFADTILENIRYGRPGASDDAVVAAARVADADGFIALLARGYQTRVGERGVVLSGGQRQRVCLARAVLAGAPVLVLDEATSSLDPESEREVQAALARVLVGRTALVIAHRLSTVVGANRIHVVDGGRVVESGTHAELVARGAVYAKLWALQQRKAGAA